MTAEAATPSTRRGAAPRLWRGLIAIACLMALTAGAGAYALWRDVVDLGPVPWPSERDASTVVLDRSGHLLRAFTTKDGRWRLPLEAKDVDQRYLVMLIAYEDHRFVKHHGVDPLAT